ncbi:MULTISPECIES: sugar phosphate isomerase/epimerase family protein [Brachybacterium]|uniref:Sugar phosphate isomerase n=1 Tax=Brachybacterium alimentarium TaxID=47845 RepID=A0A2A3YKB8_9MICO|nr:MULTISPECIES: TIM barrel protein [Brachybacterium]PCC34062.1 sugar phosphate isomerase [Brachybacterium alimentarium]PCC39545.1 sugar phosphate isomerase [Brachybacterium alimentarium]RCS64599.1 sugar phosphate isomerase/epimerase [Brachybacterium sp. JB7]RCS71005.1 sugar phosphate isomerase/epimerase [Brachybacterium alimentarium]RCS74777.1 sugar phosphate isomerase/epimerase [Brachybacterium alimentarium]
MPVLGLQLMMLKDQINEKGMYEVLRQVRELDIDAVEVSQVEMTDELIEDLVRGRADFGVETAAMSASIAPGGNGFALETEFDRAVDACRRTGSRFLRIGMMPFSAMTSKQACEEWAASVEPYAARLAEQGVTLCYHNHHVDLIQFEGERIFDIVRRVAPSLLFEVDLHWVQRGGMAPLDMLKAYSGACKLIHVKDFRIAPLPAETVERFEAQDMDMTEFYSVFLSLAQFAEVGQGNMNWPELLPAAEEAGAEYFLIEQDDTYGRDPIDCIRESREYLASIGY